MFVLCVASKGKMQDNQDTETGRDEVQSTKKILKKSRWGEIFRTLPDQL